MNSEAVALSEPFGGAWPMLNIEKNSTFLQATNPTGLFAILEPRAKPGDRRILCSSGTSCDVFLELQSCERVGRECSCWNRYFDWKMTQNARKINAETGEQTDCSCLTPQCFDMKLSESTILPRFFHFWQQIPFRAAMLSTRQHESLSNQFFERTNGLALNLLPYFPFFP